MTVPLPQVLPEKSGLHPAEQAALFRRHNLRLRDARPFSPEDVTVGVENEFQVAVEGQRSAVDLALTIESSNYYKNLTLRARRGDLSPRVLEDLHAFLGGTEHQVWENSWVRFPRELLGSYADGILDHDLRADKASPGSAFRRDVDRFIFTCRGEQWIRVPISYLLKLSLAEAISPSHGTPRLLAQTGVRCMTHLISDNSSPEITSFIISTGSAKDLPGAKTAGETSRRFFFLNLLIQHANSRFRLGDGGQTCHLYLAPNPPARQKEINDLIPDHFYRELFLNPCLSGWRRGEDKYEYMGLCHRTLSRSQLNTIAKLKEAGIIVNNLVVLPNTSNTSLANNGTHITLGSVGLSQAFQESTQPAGNHCEKYFGDLVIKIVEHFLPLFVTTFSAAPYRLSYVDFHPEKVLGFLPHELDYTHLRMIWRRWKKKAHLRFLGHSLTPVGPQWLDRLTSRLLRLRGDFIPDVRLIDYLVALLSVEQSPSLNGMLMNQDLLKRDLTEMGIFDHRMSIYLPYRMRAFGDFGFSGFEGRHYSLFPDLGPTMASAVNLQTIITALAYEWVISGEIDHSHIPDDPCIESERRQIFFDAAIGIPTFYVRADSRNQLLRRILSLIDRQRPSQRYRGYIRVELRAYLQACLAFIRRQGGWVLEMPGATAELAVVDEMLHGVRPTAAQRLTDKVLGGCGLQVNPMNVETTLFNQAAESYYRGELCRDHLKDGLDTLVTDGRHLDRDTDVEFGRLKEALTGGISAEAFIVRIGSEVIAGSASSSDIRQLLLLILLLIHREQLQAAAMPLQ